MDRLIEVSRVKLIGLYQKMNGLMPLLIFNF